MVVGLGSGSTARLAVEEIGRRLKLGTLREVVGVPTSTSSLEHAITWGVPLTTLEEHGTVDMTIDGTDEVDPEGRLIKGAGGALLREKIVAASSRRLIIVADPTKLVARLGTKALLPIEVVVFGWSTHLDAVRQVGGEPALRVTAAGRPYRTDDGHYLIDARFREGLPDPQVVFRALRARAGVVEIGLFLNFAPEVIVGRDGRQ